MSTISRALLLLTLPAAMLQLPMHATPNRQAPEEVRVTTAPVTIEAGGIAPSLAADRRAVLHLDDVRLAAGEGAVFRVFVNRPDATAATPTGSGGFVDELFLVPSQARGTAPAGRQPGQNLVLPLPAGLVRAGAPVTVTLVPVRPDAQGRLTAPGRTDLTLKRPYLTQAP